MTQCQNHVIRAHMAATWGCLLTNLTTNLQAKREKYNTRPAHSSAGLSETMTGCCDKHRIPQTRQAGGSTAANANEDVSEINMETLSSKWERCHSAEKMCKFQQVDPAEDKVTTTAGRKEETSSFSRYWPTVSYCSRAPAVTPARLSRCRWKSHSSWL